MKSIDAMVSVRDFFAILVPGAVLLALLNVDWPLDQPAGVLIFAFAVAAYIAGTVVAGVGAIADNAVDRMFTMAPFRRTARGVELEGFKDVAEALQKQALNRLDATRGLSDHWSARSFWWTQIRIYCAPGLAELDQIEARQKLFRSLIVVFAILSIVEARAGTRAAGLFKAGDSLAWTWAWVGMAVASAIPYVAGRYHFARAVYRLGATLHLERSAKGQPQDQ